MAQKDSAQKDSAQKDSAQRDSAQLKITQVRSTVGTRWRQRESLRTLGLRKIRQSVVREDNSQTRGLLAVVHHLVDVEEVS